MKHILRSLFFLICCFSSMSLSALHVGDSPAPKNQVKFYFNSNELEVSDDAIYIHLEDTLIETNIIRTDRRGLYIYEDDIANYGLGRQATKWKCPYCNHWWPFGEKCQNPDCATNRW